MWTIVKEYSQGTRKEEKWSTKAEVIERLNELMYIEEGFGIVRLEIENDTKKDE